MYQSKTTHNEQIENKLKVDKVQKLHKCCYGNVLETQLRTQAFQKLTFHQDFEFLNPSLERASNIVKDYCQARLGNQVRVKIVRSKLENNKKIFRSIGFEAFAQVFKLNDILNTYYTDEHRKLLELCLLQKQYFKNQSQSTSNSSILKDEYQWIDKLLLVLFNVDKVNQRIEDYQTLLELCDRLQILLETSQQVKPLLEQLPMYKYDYTQFLQFQVMISEAIHLMQFGDLSPAVIIKNTVFPAICAQFNPVVYTTVAFLNSLSQKQGDQRQIYHEWEDTTQEDQGQQKIEHFQDNTKILIVNFSEHEHANNLKIVDMLCNNVDNVFYASFFDGKHDTEELKQKNNNRFTIPLENYGTDLDSAEIMFVYRSFLKKKFREFDPTICILTFSISDTFQIKENVLSSFTSKLYKLSQSRLIIIPRLIQFDNQDLRKMSWAELNIKPPQNEDCRQNQYRKCEDNSNNQQIYQDLFVNDIIATINGISHPKQTRIQEKVPVKKLLPLYDQISNRLAQNEIETQFFKKQREIYTVSLKNNDMEIEKQYPSNQNNIIVLITHTVTNTMNTELQYLAIENERYQKGTLYTDKNAKYLVDYIGRNIILINGEDGFDKQRTLYHIKFSGNTKYLIESITDITQQSQHSSMQSVYSIHNNRLYQFYGMEGKQWQSIIKIYDFNQKNWFLIESENNSTLKVQQYRKDFAIVPQFFMVDNQNQQKCSFAAIGGSYANPNVDGRIYNNIIEQITIDLQKQTFKSEIVPKENIKTTRFKETANPLVLRLDESNLIYFEGVGKNNIQSFTPSVLQITTFGSKLVDSQVLNPNNDDPEQQELFIELCQLGSTTQYNYIKFQQNSTDYDVQIIFQEFIYAKQKQIDEKKLQNQGKKEILQITQFYINFKSYRSPKLHLKKQVYQSDIQIDSDENMRNTNFRYSSWLQQLSDTTIVFTSILYQYMLFFTDTQNKMQAKQFNFDDNQNDQKGGYNDYQEVLFADYNSQMVVVARKSFNNNFEKVKDFQLYYCPFINLQDVRDTLDNSLQKVELIPIQFENPIVKDTGQLLGICAKGNEYILLTSNSIYYFDRNIQHKNRKYEIKEFPVEIHQNPTHTACLVQSDEYTYTFYQQGYSEKKLYKGVLHQIWYLKYYALKNDKLTSKFKQYDLKLEITNPADGEVQLIVNNVIIVQGQIVISLILKHKQKVDLHRFHYTQQLDGQLQYEGQMQQGSFQAEQVYKQIFGNQSYSKCGFKNEEQLMKLIQ